MKIKFHILSAVILMFLTTAVFAQVGGSVTDIDNRAVICRNLTTSQSIVVPTLSPSWDCEALGLVVTPGDIVLTGALGFVAPPAQTCSRPVSESAIGTPGTTGWPFQLSNRITFNVSGEITKIGVDRWDRAGLTWDIFLWDAACNLIATASVTDGTGWHFADITPVAVNAGDVYLVGYEVSAATGSYLYRDTVSPINLGAYTVEEADYGPVGTCPSALNGALVSPVDVEICTLNPVSGIKECTRGGGALGSERVNTDAQ